MLKALMVVLVGFALVLATPASATVFYLHSGNDVCWLGNGYWPPDPWDTCPFPSYDGTELDSEGNPIGEPCVGVRDETAGWHPAPGTPFADSGLDGTGPWQFIMRIKWLSDFNNTYLSDGHSNWNILYYRNGANGLTGLAHLNPAPPPDFVQFTDYPGPDWHDILYQYDTPDGTAASGAVTISVDGVAAITLTRADVPSGSSDYFAFGGHSIMPSESYWSHVELNDLPEPATLCLLGLGGLALLRRRR